MPPKRDESQTIITISLPKKLLKLCDTARMDQLKGTARAQFVRDALAEKLAHMGITVPPDSLAVPDRVTVSLNERSPQNDSEESEEQTPEKPVEKVKYKSKRQSGKPS